MKTLIIHGSNHGCTKKCAEILEENLKGEVDIVDIRKDVKLDLNNYDKVIIGGTFNFNDMNFFERFIIRKISKSLVNDNKKFKDFDMKKLIDMIERRNIEKFAKAMNTF